MKTTTNHFWDWFLNHKNKFKNLRDLKPKEQKHYLFWLDWHIQFYFRGLECMLIFPKFKNEKIQLLITASRNSELFQKAIELEKSAPKVKNWKFTALIQPRVDIDDIEAGEDEPYVIQDITLKTSELKFLPIEYDGQKKIDVMVYLPRFTIYTNNKNLPLLIKIMIQDLLGEKSMAENINFVQLAQLTEQEDNQLIYLYDLQYYLDDINCKCINR